MTYEGNGIAQEHKSRLVVGQLVGNIWELRVYLIVCLVYLEGLRIDSVWLGLASASLGAPSALGHALLQQRREQDQACVQMTACGFWALEVPRRNLRSLSLVSCEKV